MKTSVKTTCPYCGVGCGIVATCQDNGEVSVSGDTSHPSNYGRLCSKGAALGQTIDLAGRLLYPEVKGKPTDWDHAINTVAQGFKTIIDNDGPDAIAFYVSGQLLTEDYYVANKLMKGYIGSANIDTNSRLCMSSVVAAQKRAFGSDTVPCCYEDLERAKLIVLTGSNAAWCHPVLFQRIVQAKKDNPDLYVVVIDPRRTATCDIADLHLALASGTDAILFNGLLAYLDDVDEVNTLFVTGYTQGAQEAIAAARETAPDSGFVAEKCGLPQADIEKFYRLFARTERVVNVFSQGVNQSSSGTDKINAIINCHLLTGRIGRPGMGPFSFTGQPNAMGGREVGGLANQLAAHMDIENAQHRASVQTFWNSPLIANKPGLKAVDLFDAVGTGKIKAIWIMGTNPVVSMPNADKVREALQRCELVVVSDCMRYTDTTAWADVLLPALTWGEKDGTVTNSERRISRQRVFLPIPGEARPDWRIVCDVAHAMGYNSGFNYNSACDIFVEHAALSGYDNPAVNDSDSDSGSNSDINSETKTAKHAIRDFNISALSELSDQQYADLQPIQWPVSLSSETIASSTVSSNTAKTSGKPGSSGTARLFSNGQFFTTSGKAQFIAIKPRLPVNPPDADFPLILNTGRVRDQWHTMTRTGKSPRLGDHSPEPCLAIHDNDAVRYQVVNGGLAVVHSRWGEATVRVQVSDDQQPGTVFIPMHWNGQFASNAGVGALVNPALDPLSGQPEFKHTPVRVRPYDHRWQGFILSRRDLSVSDASYWVRVTGNQFFRYEIAGQVHPDNWAVWARKHLCQSAKDVNWVEFFDGTSRYRGARFIGNRIESCIFISTKNELPSRQWLAKLFQKEMVSDAERATVISGKPPQEENDMGRIVCACFGVGENRIVDAIEKQNLTTVEAIGKQLQAGTNCGSCLPELRALLSHQLSSG